MSKGNLIAGLLISAALMGTAAAQRGPGGGMGPRQGGMQGQGQQRGNGPNGQQRQRDADPQKHLDRMARNLNLTDAQKTQVQTILADHGKQMDALRADTSLTPDQRREKMQAIRADVQSQIRGILTPEQQAEFDNRPGVGPRGPRDDRGGPPPDKQ